MLFETLISEYMTEEQFNEELENIFKIKLVSNSKLSYEYSAYERTFKLKKKRFREALIQLNKFKTEENYEIFNDRNFEVSLIQNTRFLFVGIDDIVVKKDEINKIKYTLSQPSDAYVIQLIKQITLIGDDSTFSKGIFFHRLRNRKFVDSGKETNDIIDVIKQIIPRFQTLKIESEVNRNRQEYESLAYAFLFNLSFNTDRSYLPSSIIDDLTRSIRIGRIRNAKVEDIDVPKRKYENDLVLYYQKAISSESIDIQYLSFYHIIEHFFEKIYNDEMIRAIKTELTKPSFSYKRTKDVAELIKVIQDKLKYKNEEFQINEPEALRLVIDRFIPDLNEVKNEISSYDSHLIDYYRTNDVEFSKGNKFNFNEEREKILKNLRDRIYKTRNSIVHSKETDREKYLPFKHDKILQKEIILMRIIAEKIIIESSREL